MVTQSDRDRARYEERFKAELDARSFKPVLLQQGRQEGRQEGNLIGRLQLCQEMLGQPQTPNEELLALPTAELQRLLQLLQQQLKSNLRSPGA